MKLSTITAKSIVALATAALIASDASAAPNLNSSKSNVYKLDAGNPDAEKQCIAKGASVKAGMCVMPSSGGTPEAAAAATTDITKSNTVKTGGTPGTTKEKKICIVYKAGHEGDDRYCSQSVPAPK